MERMNLLIQAEKKSMNSIYKCPYQISGGVLTVYNPLYEKQVKQITIWSKLKAILTNKKIKFVWDRVDLLDGDSLDLSWSRNYDYSNTLDPSQSYTQIKKYPILYFRNGKLIFFDAGITPIENFRDLRPICKICGIVIAEGDHTKCLEEGCSDEY